MLPLRSSLLRLGLLLAAAPLVACEPDLGECDPDLARALYYDGAGPPAYGGQALMDVGCGAGGNYCHAPAATGETRFGAPLGYDLDVRPALTPEDLDRLADSHARVRSDPTFIWGEVESGRMPPPEPSRSAALGGAAVYVDASGNPLPAIATPEADRMLRNWLACDAPVVETTGGTSTGIGDVVEPLGMVCPAGQAECGTGTCQDVGSDPRNCGACGNDCGALFCVDGACVDTCPSALVGCAGACVDPQSDAAHCGGCDQPCRIDEACSEGACGCTAGTLECAGACLDVLTDRNNCGGCGIACAAGEACEDGTCATCGPVATLSGDVQPIFDGRCATTGCHSGTRPSATLSLVAGQTHGELVGVGANGTACRSETLVVPSDPGASYLVKKLLGTAECGVQMPRRSQALRSEQLDLVRSWICHGAADD